MAIVRMFLAVLACLCMAGFRSSEACSCFRGNPTHLQDTFCQSDYVIEVIPVADEIITESSGNSPFPTGEQRRYTVNTTNVYKSSPRYEALQNKNFIFTATNSAACGVFLEKGVKYIILGLLGARDRISVNLCGFIGLRVDRLNVDQLCGLQSVYKGNCDKCKIEYCGELDGCNQQEVTRNSCLLNRDDSAFNCFNEHASCKIQSTQRIPQCVWTDLGANKLESCLDNLPEVL